jgi:hypothetical protein
MESALALFNFISKENHMKYLIHGFVLLFWANCVHYAMNALDKQGYDILLVAVLFFSGVVACSQLFLLITEAEEIVCK